MPFPYLLLLVSGGHTQFLVAENVGKYKMLGTTIDDALGECFDKSAKLMGLPYPGGPNLEKTATECVDKSKALNRFSFPAPLKGRKNCDFSFSGLKTAVFTEIEKFPKRRITKEDAADMAAAFEHIICEIVSDRCKNAFQHYLERYSPAKPHFVIAGGVAANKALRGTLESLAQEYEIDFVAPPIKLCSDNGAMIAWAGIEKFQCGITDELDFAAKPRWPLDPEATSYKKIKI